MSDFAGTVPRLLTAGSNSRQKISDLRSWCAARRCDEAGNEADRPCRAECDVERGEKFIGGATFEDFGDFFGTGSDAGSSWSRLDQVTRS